MRHLQRLLSHIPFILILSTVFVMSNQLTKGIISGKYFWFYGSMGLVSVFILISVLINSRLIHKGKGISASLNSYADFTHLFRFSITDGLVFLFVGTVFVSAFFFNDTAGNTTKIVVISLLLVLYLCIRLAIGNKQQIILLLCFFIIITGLVEAIWGMMQLYGFRASQHNLFKLTGSFFNPGPYSGYLAMIFPLALFASLSCTTNSGLFVKMKRIVAVATCIAILLVLPAGMSRASWLAAIAGSVVVLVGTRRRKLGSGVTRCSQETKPYPVKNSSLDTTSHPEKFRNKVMAKIFVIVLGMCLIVASLVGLYYLKKDSADGRLMMWKMATLAIVKNPLGVGLGHFPYAYGEAQAVYFASGNASEVEAFVAGNPEYGFNEFLHIGVESGIAALLLFVGMIVCAFRGLIRSKDWGVMGALTSLLVFACFSYPFSVLPFLIVFVFLLALAGGAQMTQINTDKKSVKIRSICVICVLVCCVIVTVFFLWKQYPVYDAYKQWKNKQMYYQVGMYKEVTQSYEPLYPYLNDQINFLFEYGRSLSQTEQFEKSNEVLLHATRISCDPMLYNIMGKNYQAMQEYDLAEKHFQKAALIVPNRIYPYYLLMKLHIETGDMDKARENAGIVLTKEPKVMSTAVKEMREEAEKIRNEQ